MNAKELRIGNHLLCDGNLITLTYHHIRIQSFADAGHVSSITNEKFKGYEPIPLTEELLIKFGFNKEIDNEFNPMVLVVNKRIHLYSDNQDNYSDIYAFMFLGKNMDEIRICDNLKFVHQLQNLYFALTGEELELEQTQFRSYDFTIVKSWIEIDYDVDLSEKKTDE